MLENSFGRTEKLLDAKRSTQLNSGCSIKCAEDIGEDKGHELVREVGREIEKTHGVQDPLEDGEAGQLVEMMEGIEESQDPEGKYSIPKLHPGRKKEEKEEDLKQ